MVSEAMLPRAAVKEVEARLTAAGCPDADFDARELFRLATGRDVRLSDRPLDAAEAAKLEELTVRRAAREPLQYLCGSWPFLDFELAVGAGVLCPRADTEVVAETAAEMLAGVEAPRVLDLCAGTGCLGLGVKRFCPAAQVTCVEKSPAAFAYLEKNARCALTGQGRQTENVLEPSALEQADVPAFDWEMAPPSDKQKQELEKRGILPDEIDNAGKANLILDRLHKRQEEGLTTPKQIRCLEKYGFQHVGTWTFEAGKNMIDRIAACGWRGAPRGVDPRNYVPEN